MKALTFGLALSIVLLCTVDLHAEDRSYDGTGNHASDVMRGSANTPMIRHGYKADFPGEKMLTDAQRTNARSLSNALSAQSASKPNARGLSDFAWAWGQFVGHDLDLTTSTNGATINGSQPIAILDPLDPLGPNPIPFTRVNFGVGGEKGGGRSPINEVSSYIDASQVYGGPERAAALRTNDGLGAKLLIGAHDLLPFNTGGLPNENHGRLPANQLFLAGDIRANENLLLTSLHTVFAREHNRLVDVIAAQQLALSAEQQYQLARKLVGAEMQIITYKEFLPALLGEGTAVPKAEGYAYSTGINAAITNAFAHATYRYGHSAVSSELQLLGDDGSRLGSISLRNAFFNPSLLSNEPGLVDQLLKGAAVQTSQEVDTLVIDDLRNFLFGPPGAGGMDLAALNIQRGRDAGLPDYNELRTAHRLPTRQNFSQITSDPEIAQKLSQMYGGNINNIDAWIGALAEDHLPGASVGPLTHAMLTSQFQRLRDGDRLFYLSSAAGLYSDRVLRPEIASIIDLDNWTLADVIEANTSISSLQANVFFAVPEPATVQLLWTAIAILTARQRRALPRRRPRPQMRLDAVRRS
jgi:hypothetical protein